MSSHPRIFGVAAFVTLCAISVYDTQASAGCHNSESALHGIVPRTHHIKTFFRKWLHVFSLGYYPGPVTKAWKGIVQGIAEEMPPSAITPQELAKLEEKIDAFFYKLLQGIVSNWSDEELRETIRARFEKELKKALPALQNPYDKVALLSLLVSDDYFGYWKTVYDPYPKSVQHTLAASNEATNFGNYTKMIAIQHLIDMNTILAWSEIAKALATPRWKTSWQGSILQEEVRKLLIMQKTHDSKPLVIAGLKSAQKQLSKHAFNMDVQRGLTQMEKLISDLESN